MGKIKFSRKMAYSTLATIGLVGSTGAIVGSVVNSNNLQTAQSINQINNQINNNNVLMDNSNTINTTSTTSPSTTNTTTSTTNNNNSNTSNSDFYNQLFLNSLNNYNNIDNTRTFTQQNSLDHTYDSRYKDTSDKDSNNNLIGGDLTNNSVLLTQKDLNELNNESNGSINSNLYNSLLNSILNYRTEWQNQLSDNFKNNLSKYNDYYIVDSIKPTLQYCDANWGPSVGGWAYWETHLLWHYFGDKTDNWNYYGTYASSYQQSNISTYESIEDSVKKGWDIVDPSDPNSLVDAIKNGVDFVAIMYIVDGKNNGQTLDQTINQLNDQSLHNPVTSSTGGPVVDDPSENYLGYVYWDDGCGTPGSPPLSQGTAGPYLFSNATYANTTDWDNNKSGIHWESDTNDDSKTIDGSDGSLMNTSLAKNGFYYEIDPLRSDKQIVPEKISTKFTNDNGTISTDPTWGEYNSGTDYSKYYNTTINPIENDTYNFDKLTKNNLSVVTYPNYTSSDAQKIYHFRFEHGTGLAYDDYYRYLLQWNFENSPQYSFDEDTYQLFVDGKAINQPFSASFDTTTGDNNLYLSNPDWSTKTNYYIENNGSQTVHNDFSDYYKQRADAEQNFISMFSNPQLQVIMQNMKNDANSFDVYNLNGVSINSLNPFGFNTGSSNTSFGIQQINMPQNGFSTNYGTFNVTQDNNIIFKNFLPVLASQIVVDPQSAKPTYADSNSSAGIYTNANGIKFKLSENMGHLLSVANVYNTYKDRVNAINPSVFGNSTLAQNLQTFKNNFNNFMYDENDVAALDQLFTDPTQTQNSSTSASTTSSNNTSDTSTTTTTDPDAYINNPVNADQIESLLENTGVLADHTQNIQTIVNLIKNIFNMNNTSSLLDSNGNLTSTVKQVLELMPTAVKNAMTNLDIKADINFGDTSTEEKDQTLWDATTGQFNEIGLRSSLGSTSGDSGLGNNEAEINISNIHFDYKDGSTIKGTNDAYTDNLDFLNNGISNSLNYTLSEFDNTYSNQDAITINNNTITYKVKYNPNFENWTPVQNSLDSQGIHNGIPISSSYDNEGVLASQYTTSNANEISWIDNSINNYFSPSTLIIDSSKTKVLTNALTGIDATSKARIEEITSDLTPDDTIGSFYCLVTITNSQNFADPEGDSNGVVVPGEMWYVSTDSTNNQTRTYLVKMNAAKKNFNISDLWFNYTTTDKTFIAWGANSSTNYYYNASPTHDPAKILVDSTGVPLSDQTIVINNDVSTNQYLNIINDIGTNYSFSNTAYANLAQKIQAWFVNFYGDVDPNIAVNSLSITTNSDNSQITINIVLNTNTN